MFACDVSKSYFIVCLTWPVASKFFSEFFFFCESHSVTGLLFPFSGNGLFPMIITTVGNYRFETKCVFVEKCNHCGEWVSLISCDTHVTTYLFSVVSLNDKNERSMHKVKCEMR